MVSSDPSDRQEQAQLKSIHDLIVNATKDTVIWLQSDSLAEEGAYVLAMQEGFADLARIIERRLERRDSPKDAAQWLAIVREVLSLLQKARGAQGHIIGKALARLADHLPKELPSAKVRSVMKSTGIIPGQFAGLPSWQLRAEKDQTIQSRDPLLEAFNREDTEVASAQTSSENSAKTAKSIVSGEEKKPGRWQDIEITFLSDHRVSIRTSQTAPKTYNYGELGFQDRRSGKSEEPKPNRAWVTLCQMAKHSGSLPRPSPGKERTILQKRMQEIRKKLRGHFGIEGDPIPFNGSRYQTSFRIRREASFET